MATDKEKLKERIAQIKELTGAFCAQKLNDDYFAISEQLIDKLGRKRPSPLLRGKVEVWAAGVIHAIGSVNFLFDPSTEPHVSADELNEFFGTKKSSTSNKAAEIRKMLKIDQTTNFEYMTDGIKKTHPLYNMVLVNGFFVPISSIPEEYQQLVKEARDRGEDISFTTE